ncbi:MAG: hypothetical protein WCJ30_00475 [Deltaproteobacteria bacterium]
MNRNEFEALRNLPDKLIKGDIRFGKSKQTSPSVIAEMTIETSGGQDLKMQLRYNGDTASKTINVTAVGIGPICRLDVDGTEHPPAGRNHKHSVQTERCPDRNLPDNVTPRADLAGMSFRHVFGDFCLKAGITHEGISSRLTKRMGHEPAR